MHRHRMHSYIHTLSRSYTHTHVQAIGNQEEAAAREINLKVAEVEEALGQLRVEKAAVLRKLKQLEA